MGIARDYHSGTNKKRAYPTIGCASVDNLIKRRDAHSQQADVIEPLKGQMPCTRPVIGLSPISLLLER